MVEYSRKKQFDDESLSSSLSASVNGPFQRESLYFVFSLALLTHDSDMIQKPFVINTFAF